MEKKIILFMMKAHILGGFLNWYIWSHEYSTEEKQKVFNEMLA